MKPMFAIDNQAARAEFKKWEACLTDEQFNLFINSTIAPDRGDWCIQSGDDLISDHTGFGKTPAEAVKDFLGRGRSIGR